MYPSIRIHPRYLWEQPSHPISVFICAICGRFLRTLTYVGDSLCCLRFILPRIPQIFTDFIYPCIRVHPRYLWDTPSHPISVFICDICGSHHLHLEIILPRIPRIFTDFDYFEINIRVIIEICVLLRTQYPCSSAISVGDFLCSLRFILPRIPQIFTDFIYPRIRVHPRYLWKTSPHPISVLICDICGSHHLQLEIYSPTDSTDFTDFIYPRIRVHPRYLWKTSPHPISVLICDICGSHHLQLEIYSPTDSTDFTDFIYPTCYL